MIKNIQLNRDIAQLILLQRIELLTPFLKRVRKILGRYFFTNFVSKYFISPKLIGTKYLESMLSEYNFLVLRLKFHEFAYVLPLARFLCDRHFCVIYTKGAIA